MNIPQTLAGRDLKTSLVLSALIGLLMAGVSLIGLFYPHILYPSVELRGSYLTTDVANLLIGIPILYASLWWAREGKLVGVLFWPGALFYILYNYIAYVFGIPFSGYTLIYILLVLMSAFILFALLRSLPMETIQQQLDGAVPVKTAGWYLVLFGGGFLIRAVAIIIQAVSQQTALPAYETGVLIADLVLSPAWLAGGILLILRKPLGFTSGLGLLFSGSMLFVGLIIVLLLQPALTGESMAWGDIFVVAILGSICSIPFILYLRGTLSRGV
jgi:hypothetical protein